jgi:glyoxylase-like metal-dependent hydrolase (beta-lactamase superfamily II)
MFRPIPTSFAALLIIGTLACSGGPPSGEPTDAGVAPETATPASVRLYVFDCGTLRIADPGRFSLTVDEVSTLELSVPCFLIEHGDGTLLWDAGLSDGLAEGSPHTQANGTVTTVTATLRAQLQELGYEPADITYLALSHLHYDHAGNANDFAASTWLIQRPEHEAAFGEVEGFFDRALYAALENSETMLLDGDHDVFGDDTVVIKSAPGHTPGHQVLFVNLAETGPVVLSGDLYHFPESRTLKRVPTFNFDEAQTLASMDAIEDFMGTSGARLWIEHDFAANARLDKSPAYYQ